jgi:hypothetical protein
MPRPRTSAVSLLTWAIACGPGQPTDTTGDPSTGAQDPSTGSTAGPSATPTTDAPPTTTGDLPDATTGGSPDPMTDPTTGAPMCEASDHGCAGFELIQHTERNEPAGIELCANLALHRHDAVACVQPFAVEPCTDREAPCEPCDLFPTGFCHGYFGGTVCSCEYPCREDADCGPGSACLCSSGVPNACADGHSVGESQCVPADCRTDADCGGLFCGVSLTQCGSTDGLFCHTLEDECQGDADCPDDSNSRCAFDRDSARWVCDQYTICD